MKTNVRLEGWFNGIAIGDDKLCLEDPSQCIRACKIHSSVYGKRFSWRVVSGGVLFTRTFDVVDFTRIEWPFKYMHADEWVDVLTDGKNAAIAAHVYGNNAKPKKKFKTRKTDTGFRIWRIS